MPKARFDREESSRSPSENWLHIWLNFFDADTMFTGNGTRRI
jgi:hypothetical protein